MLNAPYLIFISPEDNRGNNILITFTLYKKFSQLVAKLTVADSDSFRWKNIDDFLRSVCTHSEVVRGDHDYLERLVTCRLVTVTKKTCEG